MSGGRIWLQENITSYPKVWRSSSIDFNKVNGLNPEYRYMLVDVDRPG